MALEEKSGKRTKDYVKSDFIFWKKDLKIRAVFKKNTKWHCVIVGIEDVAERVDRTRAVFWLTKEKAVANIITIAKMCSALTFESTGDVFNLTWHT